MVCFVTNWLECCGRGETRMNLEETCWSLMAMRAARPLNAVGCSIAPSNCQAVRAESADSLVELHGLATSCCCAAAMWPNATPTATLQPDSMY